MMLKESFEVHETLNPKLFGKDMHLLPEVRAKLIEIVKYFEEYIEVPLDICDVQLVGSNVSYNYIKKSDFNKTFDIKLKGIEIELYIQNVNSMTQSNGIYSLCDDEWVKEPKPLKSATKHNTEKELEKWREIIKAAIASNDSNTIKQTLNTLYLIRHNSIAVEGEYGKGNQLFKDIRSEGLLQRLKDAEHQSVSKELSLEHLSEDWFINRFI